MSTPRLGDPAHRVPPRSGGSPGNDRVLGLAGRVAQLARSGPGRVGLGPQAFKTPGFRHPFVLDAFNGGLPMVPQSIDPSVLPPTSWPSRTTMWTASLTSCGSLARRSRAANAVSCAGSAGSSPMTPCSGNGVPSEEAAPADLTGFRIFVNRDYGPTPPKTTRAPRLKRLGAIGSAVRAYPIPRPPCGTTYGYKVQAFIQASGLRAEPGGFDEPPRWFRCPSAPRSPAARLHPYRGRVPCAERPGRDRARDGHGP